MPLINPLAKQGQTTACANTTLKEKRREFVHPSDLKDGKPVWCTWDDFDKYYEVKKQIIDGINPNTVAELGVRFGYSSFVFLSNTSVQLFHGYDNFSGIHGANVHFPNDWETTLKRGLSVAYPSKQIDIFRVDTQQLEKLNCTYDFIYVDADHTTPGCYHDMTISWQSLNEGGWMLVDDYDFLNSVRVAVDKWVKAHEKGIKEAYYKESLRGEYLIQKNRQIDNYFIANNFQKTQKLYISRRSAIVSLIRNHSQLSKVKSILGMLRNVRKKGC